MTARFGLTAVAALAAGVLLTAGCTGDPEPAATSTPRGTVAPAGEFRLVAYDTCKDALAGLRRAAKEHVGPYGLGEGLMAGMSVSDARAARPQAESGADAAKSANAAPGTDYSGTNTHEAGVDEPDLVKTDGRRIVTIARGVLHVVDPATRKVTGKLDLATDGQDPLRWGSPDLLLSGDRALVLVREMAGRIYDVPSAGLDKPTNSGFAGMRLLLVDLSGSPRLLSSYTMDGGLVDARQVGATARVVVRSAPRITFPYARNGTDKQRLAANRAIIDKASLADWLPRYEVTSDGRTERGRVECGSVSRPEKYSGASMMTLLTFDLGAQKLDDGQPVTVVADGDTVYSNGPSLYVASDDRWRAIPSDGAVQKARPSDARTELYKFDTSGSGRPRYVAAGSVPGYLINQYALSEWDGHLRAATTSLDNRESTVYVLRQDGQRLVRTGKVGGLGKGERIYAVRFVGPVGYVVTFRQTDPLYTVDLADPAKPKVTGELKITGYSAYLHPADDGRLIGVGQEASEQGRAQGTQVSLFDVSDLNHPDRLAQYHVKSSSSEAEYDPHAFLYWPADRLLVIPLTVYQPAKMANGTALVLRVGDNKLTEVGLVTQQADLIRRALVVDDVLWTRSDSGLQATNMSTLDKLAWIRLS